MRKYILVFLLTVAGLSCKKESALPLANNTIKINDSELRQKNKASELFQSIEIVPLETTDKSLVGNITKTIVSDWIYVMDEKDMSVTIFDLKGNFINKINRRGRGPQEYMSLCDFTITNDGTVVILDSETQQVLSYDISGKFLSRQKLSFFADAIEPLDNQLFVLNGSSVGPRVFVWNMEKNSVVKSYFEYDQKFSTRILKPLIKYGNRVYYTHAYSSSIWQINKEIAEIEWYIDFGRRNVKEEDIQKGALGYYSAPPNTIYMGRLTETDDYVVFSFECEEINEYPYYVYYDKEKKGKRIVNYDNYEDDILFNKYPPQIVGTTDDGKLVQTITAYHFLNNRSEYDISKFSNDERQAWDKYEEILHPVQEFDNPIVIFYTLKNDAE